MDTPGHLQDLLATLKLAEIAVDARSLTTDPSVQALGCALFVHGVKRNFYGSCGGRFHARDVHQAQWGHSNISLHNDNPSRISPVVPRAICHEAVSALLASSTACIFSERCLQCFCTAGLGVFTADNPRCPCWQEKCKVAILVIAAPCLL